MGCSLCALQKREEHYKLLYEITQVNGHDFSKSGRVDAVPKDPTVVQLLRRNRSSRDQRGSQEVCVVDACAQTDITFEHIMAKRSPCSPPVPDICPFLLSDSCHSIPMADHEYFDCPEFVFRPQAEIEWTEEPECEEVELCRMNSQEKLGLTFCYRTDEDDAAIFVDQVEPDSIASRDGRIREGDRILQDKEAAVALLSNENSRSVLLVTRPEGQMDGNWLDEDHRDLLEELKIEISEEQKYEGFPNPAGHFKRSKRLEERSSDTATCSSTVLEEDSGVKCSIEEISTRDLLSQAQTRTQKVPVDTMSFFSRHEPGQSGRMTENGVECDCVRQLLELECKIHNVGECGLVYRRSSTIECSLTDQCGSGVARELHMLNEELRSIERECQNIMRAQQLRRNKCDSPRLDKENRLWGGKLADLNEHPDRLQGEKIRDKDTSSSYNTAERYVARRPTRDRILRERALRIREERSGGMTTDDDTVSELKMGRYWSKEQRKRQLAQAKEQRRRREFMQRSRLECLKETVGSEEVNILDLSHKKMLKKRSKKILDNWMTIQELMSHGARVPEGSKAHSAFLSVTTV